MQASRAATGRGSTVSSTGARRRRPIPRRDAACEEARQIDRSLEQQFLRTMAAGRTPSRRVDALQLLRQTDASKVAGGACIRTCTVCVLVLCAM